MAESQHGVVWTYFGISVDSQGKTVKDKAECKLCVKYQNTFCVIQ